MTGNANSGNHRQRRYIPARGNTTQGHRQISIAFPEELFRDILASAQHDQISFASKVRDYCEWGVENEDNNRILKVKP